MASGAKGRGRVMDFRVGDVVRIPCPFTEAQVTGKQKYGGQIVVEWPWWSADPDCDWIHWNGRVVADGDPGLDDGHHGLFRTDPAPDRLTAGDTCHVGIPPTLVHVIAVAHYDPPKETGRLPRPRRETVVLFAGRSYDSRLEEQGGSLDPDDDIPVTFGLVLRPYAFLEPGDEIADAAGRARRFDGPWDWHPFDGAEPREPLRPLTLLTREGRVDAAATEAGAAVAETTKTGSHQEERACWSALAQARPDLS
ncbi:hypothetical protein [Streptomyces sp. Wb2n-11]|uniref:hypothetical protein n=1 Tax=Streptomyces sp. Wb2n-11 TaxID=1030533 RepID=UPI0021005FC5|nr:hypothetical protein [Streptomyces sp. Wb2n-11]